MKRSIPILLALGGVAYADEPVEPPVVVADPPVVAPTPSPPAEVAKRPPEPEAPPPSPSETVASPAFEPWSAERITLRLDVFTAARWIQQSGEDLTDLRLERGEVGVRIGLAPRAAADLRLEAVRSAGEGGTLGVDGDSLVARVKVAQVGGSLDVGPVRLDGALGLAPDPWISTLEAGYPLRALSRTASERLLGWPVADLSAVVRASFGPARLSIAAGNGEGLRYPERNSGKTTTAVIEVVPVHTEAVRVVLAGVGRDGSLGAASTRDRRVGGGGTVITPKVRGGLEVVRAWGLDNRGDIVGTALAGWAEATPVDRVAVAARGATLGIMGGRTSTFGGAIAVAPWTIERGDLRVWLALDRQTASGTASPVPGTAAANATVFMLIASAEAPFTP